MLAIKVLQEALAWRCLMIKQAAARRDADAIEQLLREIDDLTTALYALGVRA